MKNLNESEKLVTVQWVDAETKMEEELDEVIAKGAPIKESYGKIVFMGKDLNNVKCIILQTEICTKDNSELGDYTIIPQSLILSVK